jgi:hypothetical protein
MLQVWKSSSCDFGRVVRMNSNSCEHARVLAGNANGCFQVGRPFAGTDCEDVLNTGGASTVDDRGTIGCELRIVKMTMRVCQLHDYLSRAPGAISSTKPVRTGGPPSTLAATIMPCEVRPRSLRGARLATMTTLRPTS